MHVMGKEEAAAASRVIESGRLFRYHGGDESECKLFEDTWSKRIGVDYTIAVTSGTAALTCALVGLGIGPGDEVIVPGYTFIASASAPMSLGALPVPAEVDESLTLDPEDVRRKITPRTKAIIPVHMVGLPCDMDGIMAVAREHNLKVLEDVAQASGGSYKGQPLGSIGDAGAFSFNYYKIISCGEGGAVTTNDRQVYLDALIFHDSGCITRSNMVDTPYFSGMNFRMNEILGAILRVQEGRLDDILTALRRDKFQLMDELADQNQFRFNPINDPAGDCGSMLSLLYDSAEQAEHSVQKLQEAGFGAGRPVDLDRHVYTKWTPMMRHRGSYHPERDPLQVMDYHYHEDMCPRTLDYLGRSVHIPTKVDRSPEEFSALVEALKQA